MASIYREIGEEMESIFNEIKEIDFVKATKEDLKNALESIQYGAKESYIGYALELGWHESREEAENYLEEKEEEQKEQKSKGFPAYRFKLSNWIAEQKGLSSTEIIGLLEDESNKAYRVFLMSPSEDVKLEPIWLPKSQAEKLEEIKEIKC